MRRWRQYLEIQQAGHAFLHHRHHVTHGAQRSAVAKLRAGLDQDGEERSGVEDQPGPETHGGMDEDHEDQCRHGNGKSGIRLHTHHAREHQHLNGDQNHIEGDEKVRDRRMEDAAPGKQNPDQRPKPIEDNQHFRGPACIARPGGGKHGGRQGGEDHQPDDG